MTAALPARAETAALTADFRGIYDQGVDHVWHYLRRMGIPEADRDDLVQDVFVVVHRRLADYDRSRPLRPWLIGIAVRLALRHWRLSKKLPMPVDEDLVVVDESQASPEELVEDRQSRNVLAQALHRLKDERRAVLVLHDLEEIPVPEVAEMLQIPLNTAYSRLRRARQDLARSVKKAQVMGARP